GTSAADDRGTNGGTYTGSVSLGVAGALNGDPDTAAAFTTNGFVNVPDKPALDPGNQFTIELWFKRGSTTSTTPTLVTKGTNGYQVRFSSNKLYLRKSGVGNVVASTTSYTDTKWHYLDVTKSGASSHIYVDGVDVSGVITDQTIQDTTSVLNIGRSTASSSPEYYEGALDEVAIYPVALTAAQVAAHFSAAPNVVVGPPAPTIGTKPASPTNATTASFGFTDTQAGVSFLCSLDAAAYAACTSPKNYTALAEGSHTFGVEAQDSGGAISAPTTFTWTVDLTPPPA